MFTVGDDKSNTKHKFLAGVRSKAIEEYTETKAGQVRHFSGSDGSSKRDLVVYYEVLRRIFQHSLPHT